MCWPTSWDVDCDHCVTAERDYLLFLSRHFIILESDKYPGESRTPHLIMSSQCLYFRTPDYYQEYESSCSRASSSLSSDSGSDLYCAARPDKTYYRVQVSHGAKLKRPTGVAVSGTGNSYLYSVDIGHDCVRKYRYC